MYWKAIWWLMKCPGRLENKAQNSMRTCGKLGGWNYSQGDNATGLASLLPTDLDAATPFRVSSELALLFLCNSLQRQSPG